MKREKNLHRKRKRTFLQSFGKENQATLPEGDQVFGGEDNGKLRIIIIRRQGVRDDVDGSEKINKFCGDASIGLEGMQGGPRRPFIHLV